MFACPGIDGVLQAYYACIQRVQLYGPTNASPIIRHVANFAAAAQREEPQKGAHVSELGVHMSAKTEMLICVFEYILSLFFMFI